MPQLNSRKVAVGLVSESRLVLQGMHLAMSKVDAKQTPYLEVPVAVATQNFHQLEVWLESDKSSHPVVKKNGTFLCFPGTKIERNLNQRLWICTWWLVKWGPLASAGYCQGRWRRPGKYDVSGGWMGMGITKQLMIWFGSTPPSLQWINNLFNFMKGTFTDSTVTGWGGYPKHDQLRDRA